MTANPMPGESAWRLGGPFASSLPGAQGGNSQVFGVISRDKSRRSGKRDVVSPGRFPSNDDAARLLSHHLHDGRASLSLDLGDQASQQAYGHQALEWRLSKASAVIAGRRALLEFLEELAKEEKRKR